MATMALLAACAGEPEEAASEPGEVMDAPDTVAVPTLSGAACDSVRTVDGGSREAEALIVGLLASEPDLGASGQWPEDVDAGVIVAVGDWYLAELRMEDETRPGVWAVQRADSTYRYAGARWLGAATDAREVRRALYAALPDAPPALVGCYQPGEWFSPPPADAAPLGTTPSEADAAPSPSDAAPSDPE